MCTGTLSGSLRFHRDKTKYGSEEEGGDKHSKETGRCCGMMALTRRRVREMHEEKTKSSSEPVWYGLSNKMYLKNKSFSPVRTHSERSPISVAERPKKF